MLPIPASVNLIFTAVAGRQQDAQQLHLNHDEVIGLNISTKIDNELLLFRTFILTNIDEVIIQ